MKIKKKNNKNKSGLDKWINFKENLQKCEEKWSDYIFVESPKGLGDGDNLNYILSDAGGASLKKNWMIKNSKIW